MSEFFKDFLPIGVILTFIVTILNILMTFKSIKSTKYIDTITSERIKWINTIRDEVTNIIVNINLTLKVYSENIKEREIDTNNYKLSIEEESEEKNRHFDAITSSALSKEKPIWSESDFVKFLFLFKLRLNFTEDQEIIEIVDYFIKFYTENEYKSKNEIQNARNNANFLVLKTQNLLKKEWEKVKRESKGKITMA